jgi:hypothetical protein
LVRKLQRRDTFEKRPKVKASGFMSRRCTSWGKRGISFLEAYNVDNYLYARRKQGRREKRHP